MESQQYSSNVYTLGSIICLLLCPHQNKALLARLLTQLMSLTF